MPRARWDSVGGGPDIDADASDLDMLFPFALRGRRLVGIRQRHGPNNSIRLVLWSEGAV